MAAVLLSPSRAARIPARSRRTHSLTESFTEPPNKKRRYAPADRRRRVTAAEDPEDILGNLVARANDAGRPRNRGARAAAANSAHPPDEEEIEMETVSRPATQSRPRRDRPERYYAQPATPRPRYSNAAAAAAASQASDGYKPREERSWEDFHPDLDIDAGLMVFNADEVDGRARQEENDADIKPLLNGDGEAKDTRPEMELTESIATPTKRKPGRPPRKPESMLSGLGSPPAPRIMPLPTHNPKERLNLPKPAFRHYNHFLQYEDDQVQNKVNYVDRTMAHAGYQESDRFELPAHVLVRVSEGGQVDDEAEVGLHLESDGSAEAVPTAPVVGKVEYDMDEQDVAWLDGINELRKSEGVDAIKPAIFEITMTQIEKEYHALEKRIPKPQPRHAQTHRPRSSSQAAVNGDPNPPGDEPDSKCSICDDGDCENANAIIFCDGCDLAVHQECYGVPFIPEGQWFCRKCKEIGRGTPTCIFCPNVDGAFKQTNTLRWSHLLCAIWIPEVTIANMTFMEPIQDVDKVPKGRWKLHCYICNQKMGACIQCGNKNCYQAFHVTCARRAKLFLRMKSAAHQGLDTTALKAFCDKHVPPDWRRMHDTDYATAEAKRWYKYAMKDRKWADSQSAALELGAPPPPDGGLLGDAAADEVIVVSKKRRNQSPKMSWRLPSGAPVVPAVVYNTVEASLARFTVRKRKEFVEKVCRYWTLKREARRGAALLKRLQLQLESFSSMEITRRNFAGMGAVGRPRLLRRIEFAEMLQKDMSYLTDLTREVRAREDLRLKEIELLRDLVDTVYFPIPVLLQPILQKARKLDEKTRAFTEGFDAIAIRLRERQYTSVSDFSSDLSSVITTRLAATADPAVESASEGVEAIHSKLTEVRPGTAEHMGLTQDQKDLRRLAKRILKAVKESLEGAVHKEAELRGRELEEELQRLENLGLFGGEKTTEGAVEEAGDDAVGDIDMRDVGLGERTDEAVIYLNIAGKNETVPIPNKKTTPASKATSCTSSNHDHHLSRRSTAKNPANVPAEPLSPPISTDSAPTDATDCFAMGGVPWYLTPFDPAGTTVHEERYTGRAVLRDMSEELSDMDDDTLTGLAGNAIGETSERRTSARQAGPASVTHPAAISAEQPKVQKKAKKKARRQMWSKPRTR